MDEIMLYAGLRPEPPEGAGALLEAVRGRMDAALSPGPRTRPSRRRRRAAVLAACALAAVTGVSVALPSVLSGRQAGSVVTVAWTVQQNPDGTIKITFKQASDAAGLQRTLRAEGVPAYVRFTPWVVRHWGHEIYAWPAQECNAAGGPPVPRKVVEAVFPFPAGAQMGNRQDAQYAMTIDPAAIPRGDAILIQVTGGYAPSPEGMSVGDEVMGTSQPPVCTPQVKSRADVPPQ